MKIDEEVLVTYNGVSDLCAITGFENSSVILTVKERNYKNSELPVEVYLFQGLPKSDKFELIIQKAVELGVKEIIPVEMKFCIAKIEEKKKAQKLERFNLISESAAKQSKRNIIPKVSSVLTFKQAVEYAKRLDLFILPYESANGTIDTKKIFSKIKKGMKIGVMIGAEGGFSDEEVAYAKENGADVITLGKRILRTETASITTLSAIMLYSELNFD